MKTAYRDVLKYLAVFSGYDYDRSFFAGDQGFKEGRGAEVVADLNALAETVHPRICKVIGIEPKNVLTVYAMEPKRLLKLASAKPYAGAEGRYGLHVVSHIKRWTRCSPLLLSKVSVQWVGVDLANNMIEVRIESAKNQALADIQEALGLKKGKKK